MKMRWIFCPLSNCSVKILEKSTKEETFRALKRHINMHTLEDIKAYFEEHLLEYIEDKNSWVEG